jgi:hypothetical protein
MTNRAPAAQPELSSSTIFASSRCRNKLWVVV